VKAISPDDDDGLASSTPSFMNSPPSLPLPFFSTELNSVLSRLTSSSKPSTSRTTAQRPSQSSLSHLLADEKIHGTRERDLSAPRPDYHYFTKGSYYVLCEDATGEYRTVLAKEYDRPRGGEAPEWPVLHGNFLKASTSAPVKMEPVEHKLPPLQKKTSTASASKVPIGLSAKTRLAAVRENGAAGDLRRSASLNNLSKTAKLVAEEERLLALANEGPNDEAGVDRPYIAASGNSVGITSTITSAQSGTGHGGGGNNAAAMKRDQRRVVELPRKVVPVVSGLRGLAPSRMTDQSKVELLPSASITGKRANAVDEDQRMIDLDSTPAGGDDEEMVVVEEEERERTAGGPAPAVESRKRKHMADHVHRTLAVGDPKGKAAGRMDPPPPIKKRYSFPGALPRREKSMVRLPPREENKKPGYCENCRVKFDDFSEVSFSSFFLSLSSRGLAARSFSLVRLFETKTDASLSLFPPLPHSPSTSSPENIDASPSTSPTSKISTPSSTDSSENPFDELPFASSHFPSNPPFDDPNPTPRTRLRPRMKMQTTEDTLNSSSSRKPSSLRRLRIRRKRRRRTACLGGLWRSRRGRDSS